MNEDSVLHSSIKLSGSALELKQLPSEIFRDGLIIEEIPSTYSESHSYRNSCGFQFLVNEDTNLLEYAMRDDFVPLKLNSDVFPVGNERVQTAMRDTLKFLNGLRENTNFSNRY